MGKKKGVSPTFDTDVLYWNPDFRAVQDFVSKQVVSENAVDVVNHPPHYTSDPSGVECITITRHRNFNIGNAIKYLWRNGLKHDTERAVRDKQIEDLRKAVFYIEDEIARLDNLRNIL